MIHPLEREIEFVDMTKEELINALHEYYTDYVRRLVEVAQRQSKVESDEPQYRQDRILRRLGQRIKRVHTTHPVTRIGLDGYRIAALVLPAVKEITGGDEAAYKKFFEEYMVPLGVTTDDVNGYYMMEDRLC